MAKMLFGWFTPEDWKRSIAVVILWAYAYQLVAWPLCFWASTLLTVWVGTQIPAPPVVPWEQLLAGTSTLATVGGIQAWKDKNVGGDSSHVGGTD